MANDRLQLAFDNICSSSDSARAEVFLKQWKSDMLDFDLYYKCGIYFRTALNLNNIALLRTLHSYVEQKDSINMCFMLDMYLKEPKNTVSTEAQFILKDYLITVHSHRAQYFMSLSMYQDAIKECDKIIGMQKDNALANECRSVAYINTGCQLYSQGTYKYLEAIDAFNEATKVDQPSLRAQACYRKGYTSYALASKPEYEYCRKEEYTKLLNQALEALNQGLKSSPDKSLEADIYDAIGAVYLVRREYMKATGACASAIKINPSHSSAYYHKGLAHQLLKHYTTAIKEYDLAIKHCSNYMQAYFNKGATLMSMSEVAQDSTEKIKKINDAIKFYEMAIECQPSKNILVMLYSNLGDVYTNLGYASGDIANHQKALEYCDKAIAENPKFAAAYYNKGNVLKALGKHQEALGIYDQAITNAVQNDLVTTRATANKALILEALGAQKDPASVQLLLGISSNSSDNEPTRTQLSEVDQESDSTSEMSSNAAVAPNRTHDDSSAFNEASVALLTQDASPPSVLIGEWFQGVQLDSSSI